jgi:peptidoglycan L-alanyl-D-glutamate endopeptidase CwlK
VPKFGKKSLDRLDEVHEDLQKIAHKLIERMDVTVLCGYRGKEEQEQAFINGNSKLRFPHSKHNKKPSLAMDIAPFPIDWKDMKRFIDMCKAVEEIAAELGIKIILGRDFEFRDMPHIELVTEKDIQSGHYERMQRKATKKWPDVYKKRG